MPSHIPLAPGIHFYENLITSEECEHITTLATTLLSDSMVSGKTEGYVSNGRISHNCWLAHNTSPTTQTICDKISNLVGMPLKNAEKMQVVHYETGGKYNTHYDSWDHDNSNKQKRMMKYGGQRLLTALVYLNNVDEGGGTHFPKKDVLLKPQKGSMVVFKNCVDDTNQKDVNSLHAGMPVVRGEKWIFNLWFREAPMHQQVIWQQVKEQEHVQGSVPVPTACANTNRAQVEHAHSAVVGVGNNKLDVGDYVPFISWWDGHCRYLHNFVDDKPIIIAMASRKDTVQRKLSCLQHNLAEACHLVYIIYNTNNSELINTYFTDPRDGVFLYVLDCERRIVNIERLKAEDTLQRPLHLPDRTPTHIPYLEIPDVLDKQLLHDAIQYAKAHEHTNSILHNSATKNRIHVHPNPLLEKQFDAKFRKTVFYKMQEVFCFKVKYRELYKICTYNHLTNGRFHAHRDTVPKYSHRVYGMSVVLNDDYAGGELEFPEYHLKLKPRTNTAIVFPGTYSHRVHPVTRGKRMTIITFLCKETEDRTTYNKQYWLKG